MPFGVEPTGAKQHECECCGRTSRTVWGWVHAGTAGSGDTRAAYYAGWVEGHADSVIHLTISLGQWGDGASAAERQAVAIDLRSFDGQPQCMIVDDAFIQDPDSLGHHLPRDEALANPSLSEFWEITDAILEQDTRLTPALQQLR
jgi:hypothetical protein